MKNIFQAIRQWQRDNAAAKLLNRMGDTQLNDMGITRGEAPRDIHIFH